MHRTLMAVLLASVFFFDAMGAWGVDLKHLTAECRRAEKAYQGIRKNFAYKQLHEVQYRGWIGDLRAFDLTHPVQMTIRWAGAAKSGQYWLINSPEKKYKVAASSDAKGNIKMVARIHDRATNHTMHGLMKDGVIMGVWSSADATKAYAFYVRAAAE